MELEKRSLATDFWNDPETAQKVMRDLSARRAEVAFWTGLGQRTTDALDLLELAMLEEDESVVADLVTEAEQLTVALDRAEFELMMPDKHDRSDAILAIHAGAGGTEAQDWTQMLLRMFLRWAERRGYAAEIIDSLSGEEAGIKRVAVSIQGRFAYGFLRAEKGVHRLVRLSPYDSAHRRHTSFALVEVWPDLGEDIDIQIRPDEVKMEVYRSSGAGGQHMQKNSTAVRLIHVPTGIVVTCENERSQTQNREFAMKILRGRLYDQEKQKQADETAKLKGEHVGAGWGNQIRSYVLHPYNLVKDLRTGYETGNTSAVLDGDLDSFIEAYLKASVEA